MSKTAYDLRKEIEAENQKMFEESASIDQLTTETNPFEPAQEEAPSKAQEPAQEAQEAEQNWKQLYGRSENEKGELRRQLEEERRQKLEYEQMARNVQPVQSPQQSNSFDWFAGMPDEDVYDPSKLKRHISDRLNLLATVANAQIEAVKSRASRKDWDITPEEENAVRKTNAFLNYMPPKEQDDFVYKQVKASRLLNQMPEVEKSKEIAKQVNEQARTRAFVESSSESVEPEPKSMYDQVKHKFDKGKLTAKQMKEELHKVGIHNVDDFRRIS